MSKRPGVIIAKMGRKRASKKYNELDELVLVVVILRYSFSFCSLSGTDRADYGGRDR